MAKDLLNMLQEIRGVLGPGEIAPPTEKNGIYHDVTVRTVNDDGSPRYTYKGEGGIYGDIKFMYYTLTLKNLAPIYEHLDYIYLVGDNIEHIIKV